MEGFKFLFNPLTIGDVILKNRITLAPMFLCYGNSDGTVSEKMIEFYARRAKAGVSLLVVEASAIDAKGIGSQRTIRVDDDIYIPGLSRLAKAIKDAGGLAVLQIYHGGRYSLQPVAPSAVETYLTPEMKILPKEMTREEITDVINKFGKAAERAKKAGSVREHVGKDFLLGYRFMPDEWLPDGFALNEGKIFARRLEQVGIDYLSCNAGTYESWALPDIIQLTSRPGYQVDITHEIKKEVKIPVLANGRINMPELAEEIIHKGKADAVALARPLFADPEFVQKIVERRTDQIIKCVNDWVCMRKTMQGRDAVCSQWEKVKV